MLPGERVAVRELRRHHARELALNAKVRRSAQRILAPPVLKGTYPRQTNRAVLVVTLGLLAKQCKTARGVELIAQHGIGQDALALCRVMFETLVVASWLLRRQSAERVTVYLAHWAYQKKKWVDRLADTKGVKRLAPKRARRAADAFYAQTKLDLPSGVVEPKRHWHVGGLEGAVKELRSHLYASFYRYASAHSHAVDFGSHVDLLRDSAIATTLIPGTAHLSESLFWARIFLWGTARLVDDKFQCGHTSHLQAVRPAEAGVMLRGLVKP